MATPKRSPAEARRGEAWRPGRSFVRGHVRRRVERKKTQAASEEYRSALAWLKRELGYQESFDIIVREFILNGKAAALLYVDSMIDGTLMTLLLQRLLQEGAGQPEPRTMDDLLNRLVPYSEVSVAKSLEDARDQLLAGPALLLVDGVEHPLVLDVRQYPDRDPNEPNLERVIRGPRDGFVETLVLNTVLVRRRLRDPRLRIEAFQVGTRSRADIALLYVRDIANDHFVATVRERLQAIDTDSLTMSEKALEEWILKKPWWNPFPTGRFTERPDVAAEHLMQGNVIVLADTSPNALILPATFFSFLQSAEEYHEGIVIGTYLKWVRTAGVLFSIFGPPLWYTLIAAHVRLGGSLQVLLSPKITAVPIFWQLALAEVGVDLLRLALMFSPNSLSQSMGFFGAILLGDIAVKAGILDAEVMVYVAVAAVGTFAAPDIDFGMALRLFRVVILVLVGLFSLVHDPWAGFGLGVLLFVAIAATTKSLGIGYLWPLWPPDLGELATVLVRKPLNRNVKRPSMTLPRDVFRKPPRRIDRETKR
jgi:stage V sporulation protein AF